MKYGYARSNLEESIQLQIEVLSKSNLDKIIVDKTGGELLDLIDTLQPGDELHICTMDRLTRNCNTLIKILDRFQANNISLYCAGYRYYGFDYDIIKALNEPK